jgi:hypothetical protein
MAAYAARADSPTMPAGMTINAARALGIDADVGSSPRLSPTCAPGTSPTPAELAYWIGLPPRAVSGRGQGRVKGKRSPWA